MKTPHSMFEKGQIYICIKSDNSVWIDTPGWWGRYYTLKQFEKWFDEIIDYDIHTLEKAREKYKKIRLQQKYIADAEVELNKLLEEK